MVLVLYVDNLFLRRGEPLIVQCKRELTSEFEMKDLGLMHYFLGPEAWQRPSEIFLKENRLLSLLPLKIAGDLKGVPKGQMLGQGRRLNPLSP